MTRTAFTTSRLLEFCTTAELSKQVGFPPEDWLFVALKELVDNGLDAAEEAGIAPEITITVTTASNTLTVTVTDNGSGIAREVVARIINFRTKTSSREAYVDPTRGRQGNALQTILAMPFVLNGKSGETVIEALGIAHKIIFSIDPIRREPKLMHGEDPSLVQSGTSVTLHWPRLASSKVVETRSRIVQIAEHFGWLNPHASFAVTWDGTTCATLPATDPGWRKWRPADPSPAAWYDAEAFNRLIAACIADDQDHGRDRLVREFVAEFRGCARSGTQKEILKVVDGARTTPSSPTARSQVGCARCCRPCRSRPRA
jgi:hypothetical protein